MGRLDDRSILIIATHGFEQSELQEPLKQLKAAGAQVRVASLDGKPIRGWDQKDWGETVKADMSVDSVDPDSFDALVLPGGQINPDLLRVERRVLEIVRRFADQDKVIAAICHAPWILIEAGLVKERRMTSYKSIRTDLKNAGAEVVDEPVVADNGFVTSRNPGDIDAFVKRIIEEVCEGQYRR